jgi:hypothetical protein
MKILKFLYLVFVLFPFAIMYGSFIAFITLIEYIIDKAKMK